MPGICTLIFLGFISLFSFSTPSQATELESQIALWAQQDPLPEEPPEGINTEEGDVSTQARRRPGQTTVYRCCSKPMSGVMTCRQSTDKLLAWYRAIYACEDRYGQGNCVSGCRRLLKQ